jgi:hypothetical protein
MPLNRTAKKTNKKLEEARVERLAKKLWEVYRRGTGIRIRLASWGELRRTQSFLAKGFIAVAKEVQRICAEGRL